MHSTLTVNNSSCHIHGLPDALFRRLRELLTYRVPIQGRVDYQDPRCKRPLLTKRGDFPTGLLYLVRRFLKKHRVKFQVKDLRVEPKPHGKFVAKYPFSPYEEQASAALCARFFKRGIIVMPTGMGKSIVAALIIEKLQVNTLVVVPSVELKRQLTESLGAIFGHHMVGMWRPIMVANVDMLEAGLPSKGYDCVIIDEFHHSGAATYRTLNKHAWAGVYYKFGLTATPFRSQDHERLLLESVLSRTIYKVDYQHAVDKGYIVPMEAYYYELPKRDVKGDTWAAIYRELVTENDARNDLIRGLMDSLAGQGFSTLCLVKEIKHGECLGFPFANGQDGRGKELIASFNARKVGALVGTTGVLGEGVDTKPAEFVIIAGLGKARNAFHQQIGRGFRIYPGKETCKVILFYDRSHKWTKAHFKEQCRILRDDFGVTPVKL